MGLTPFGQLEASRAGVDLGVSDSARHLLIPAFGPYGTLYGKNIGERERTVKVINGLFFRPFKALRCSPVFAKVRLIPLSRRKQGFESPWERQKPTASMGLFGGYPSGLSIRHLRHGVARLSLAVGLLTVQFSLLQIVVA
jgi:hypothetical protein